MAGLFDSTFGKTGKGLFSALFSENGTISPVKRMDIRLGDADMTPAASNDIFSKNIAGLPVWLIAVFALGVAFSYRKG